MAQTLTKVRVEYDPHDGRMIVVYKDEQGYLHHITHFTTLAQVEYETKVIDAKEKQVRQQIKLEVAYAELDDVRDVIEQRRLQLHRQLGGVSDMRMLPAQPEIIPPRKPNGR